MGHTFYILDTKQLGTEGAISPLTNWKWTPNGHFYNLEIPETFQIDHRPSTPVSLPEPDKITTIFIRQARSEQLTALGRQGIRELDLVTDLLVIVPRGEQIKLKLSQTGYNFAVDTDGVLTTVRENK
jgi:hypothetical protein